MVVNLHAYSLGRPAEQEHEFFAVTPTDPTLDGEIVCLISRFFSICPLDFEDDSPENEADKTKPGLELFLFDLILYFCSSSQGGITMI